MDLNKKKIKNIIELAINEDIGNGDVTANAIIPESFTIYGEFIAKEPGIVAGLPVVKSIFERFKSSVSLNMHVKDGDHVSEGDLIAKISGDARTILSYERLSLNFLQRLSGIATLTFAYVKQAEKFGIKIVDTRKTTPGWRYLEKYAVRVGGGTNHREGLFDQVLIKDNHLSILCSLQPGKKHDLGRQIIESVQKARREIPKDMLIEIEIDYVENVKDALESGADIIMFDNMDCDQISKSLQIVNDWTLKTSKIRPIIEVSGGVILKNLEKIAQPGIDRLAIGAVTHSAKALDISLEIKS